MKKYTFEIRLQNGQLYHKSDNVYDTLEEAEAACNCALDDIMEYESIDLDGFTEGDFRFNFPEVTV